MKKANVKGSNIGWLCPECRVVYAPSVTECRCSVNKYYNYWRGYPYWPWYPSVTWTNTGVGVVSSGTATSTTLNWDAPTTATAVENLTGGL